MLPGLPFGDRVDRNFGHSEYNFLGSTGFEWVRIVRDFFEIDFRF